MPAEPTPKDTLLQDGTARLLRFRRNGAAKAGPPVLLVPSLINRWYVLDLREGASLAGALVDGGLDVFCLDWGVPNDEDRFLEWDDVVERLERMVRRVRRETRSTHIGLLGYCMGGTLSSIVAALEPERIAALVNLAGPVDFSHAGFLGHMTNPRWFDPEAIASAGNMRAEQMQAGFVALRPTAPLAKWVSLLDKLSEPQKLEAFAALEEWASANIAFPAAAYVRYIRDLYQHNQLVRGEHRVRGRRVDLGAIRCPLLTVVTDRDAICPAPAAQGLGHHVGSRDQSLLVIPGGHVGAVVGPRARELLYPKLVEFFLEKAS
ncbi:MAG: alpha/beta fold hydrolase [Polyangiaceae bacterium]|nr:alpha/beta fold hydrolase [Polyangiaceae bacterium]